MPSAESYTIWARETSPPPNLPVLLWNSFGFEAQHSSSISLPTYIEQNADDIRSRLLTFLCDAKYVRNETTTLEDALVTPEGLSAWWLSFPSLKQWGKRQSIPIACRLIAVEQIVGTSNLGDVKIEVDDRQLHELIQRVLSGSTSYRHQIRRFLLRTFIHPARALGSFIRYVQQTRKIPPPSKYMTATSETRFAFFDYFSGSDSSSSVLDQYRSPYWGRAPQLVSHPDWFHIYPRNVDRAGINQTVSEINRLNSRSGSRHHLFLGAVRGHNVTSLFRTFRSQRRVHDQFRSHLTNFRSGASGLALWGVFEDEWDDSIIGSTAMRHLILLKTTNELVNSMPTYSKIFYLMENQPWELALTFCVRKHRKGHLVGVAHSTIRFWDLRYFSDESENNFLNPSSRRPFPDQILVNGEIGRRLLLDNRYPEASISVVEALRYMYLKDLQPSVPRSNGHVLLLGDFLEHANSVLVSVFRDALRILNRSLSIKVRSHPICPLTELQLGDLSHSISFEKLSDLLEKASVVITTAASSSAAESAALGIPTIVVLDARSLNYSPFRKSGNVYVVENAEQLATLLQDVARLVAQPTEAIFCLDPNYPRWQDEFALA